MAATMSGQRSHLVGVRQLECRLKLRVPIVKETQTPLPLPRLCEEAPKSAIRDAVMCALQFVFV